MDYSNQMELRRENEEWVRKKNERIFGENVSDWDATKEWMEMRELR